LLRRHLQALMGTQNCLNQEALLGTSRNNGRTRIASFEQTFSRIDLHASESRLGVTREAFFSQQRSNVRLKKFNRIRALGRIQNGGCCQQSQNKSTKFPVRLLQAQNRILSISQ